ncbi:CoA-binding protein [Aliikangiella sp. G2MR2-5]|uniref:CoA-binding protein n=1 Tax=Aliikangiella sp. G2MR2-5 TaxID=2788943 RepID=UPI0018AAEF76|nr:CoA-binding protein [Aliikangiella sp. G2MR2-5]
MKTTLIYGASATPSRYANIAQHRLIEQGHKVILVNPRGGVIDGIQCLTDPGKVSIPVDTVTVYVRPEILDANIEAIASLKPRRIILNPGTESRIATDYFSTKGIEVINACTLVLLTLGTY